MRRYQPQSKGISDRLLEGCSGSFGVNPPKEPSFAGDIPQESKTIKPMKPRIWIAVAFAIRISQSAIARRKPASIAEVLTEKIDEAQKTGLWLDLEACFSPEQGCDIKFWKFIQSAKKSLDVAIYDITHVKIAHELLWLPSGFPFAFWST